MVRKLTIALAALCALSVWAASRQSELCADGTYHQVDYCPAVLSTASVDADETTASVTVSNDRGDGTTYVCVTTSETPPEDIITCSGGQGDNDMDESLSVSGLTAGTNYYAHIGNYNPSGWLSNVVTEAFETDQVPVSGGWPLAQNSEGLYEYDDPNHGTIDFEITEVGGNPVIHTDCPTRTSGVPCDYLLHSVTTDGYAGRTSPACRTQGACPEYENDDHVHLWRDSGWRNILAKNMTLTRSFKFTSTFHTDLFQCFGAGSYFGWVVLQDIMMSNADDNSLICNLGGHEIPGGPFPNQNQVSGLVLQNVHYTGYDSGYSADCEARRTTYHSTDPCTGHITLQCFAESGCDAELWLIEVTTAAGNSDYRDQWKKVIKVGTVNLPANANVTTLQGTHSYDTLEEAEADGHTLPPFVHLSCAGWGTPPEGCTE